MLNPPLYTYTTKYDETTPDVHSNWKFFAEGMITEARKSQKLIIPYVWAQYFNVVDDPNPNPSLASKYYLPASYIINQRDTMKLKADGMIEWGWGGNLRETTWNESSVWWTAIKDVLNTMKI